MSSKYKDAKSFRMALFERLKVKKGEDPALIQVKQRQIAFERLLCRLFYDSAPPWVLKGGHALELRIQNSRATKDIDLALRDSKIFDADNLEKQNMAIFELLQDKVSHDFGDYFTFNVLAPVLELDAPPYGGARFPVESFVDGKLFIRFQLDIAVGDVWIEPHEKMKLENNLEFAGIESAQILVISVEQHFAEKIHAYTLPRDSGYNSRVKDLVDMILLIQEGQIDQGLLKEALDKTFKKRNSHQVPEKLESPPAEWETRYNKMSQDCGLCIDVHESFKILETFWNN